MHAPRGGGRASRRAEGGGALARSLHYHIAVEAAAVRLGLAEQFIDSDFGRGAKADRHADGPDAAVHVELRATLPEPALHVARDQAARRKVRVDESANPVSLFKKS